MRAAPGRQVGRFLVVGAAGTAAFLIGYLLLRLAMPAQAANLIARLAVSVPTTWLNGRYTFGTRVSRRRLHCGALAVLAAGTAVSAGLLAAEQALVGPHRWAELAALVTANAGATVARFVLLRQWLFRRADSRPTAGAQADPSRPTATSETNERAYSRNRAGDPVPMR